MCQKFNNIKHKKMKIILELESSQVGKPKLRNSLNFLKTGRKKLRGKCIFAEIFFQNFYLNYIDQMDIRTFSLVSIWSVVCFIDRKISLKCWTNSFESQLKYLCIKIFIYKLYHKLHSSICSPNCSVDKYFK